MRVIRNKKRFRERERESSNLYKIKWVEEEPKYILKKKKKEGIITVKQWGDKKAKRKGKNWKKCNSKCVN